MSRTRVTLALLVVLAPVVSGCGDDGPGAAAARQVAVSTSDELRFDPASITAKPGEKVVIVLSNAGRLDHELVIGDPAYLERHAESGEHGEHGGDGGANVAAPAGKTMRLTFTMPDGDPPTFACFVDRHDKAGMTGTVTYT